jgi:hypothetical protein
MTLPFNLAGQTRPAWRERAARCAEMILQAGRDGREIHTVLDLGCGNEQLQAALVERGFPGTCKGFDLHPQSPDVTRLDLNHDVPQEDADLVAVIGVIEYLTDAAAVLERLACSFPRLIISHAVRDGAAPYTSEEVEKLGWRTHLSIPEMRALLLASSWSVEATDVTLDRRTWIWLGSSTKRVTT